MNAEFSIFAAAREAPDRIALLVEGKAVSFRELADRTAAVVAWLEPQGITRRDRASISGSPCAREIAPVGVVGSNQIETLLLIYALLELAVPLALIHPRLTATERQELLASVCSKQIVLPDSLPIAALPTVSPSHESFEPCPEWPLVIVFTSGTSGRSRAAVLSRGAFSHALRASEHNLGWQEDDRWLLCLPVCHVGGLSIVLRCLAARKAVVLAHNQGEHQSLDLARIVGSLARDQVTLLSLVPSVLQRLLDWPDLVLPDRVRAILLGGAASSPSVLEHAVARKWPILTTYGLTEACSQVTTQPYGSSNRSELGSGKPVLGTELRIASDGAIEIKSPSLFSGYLDADELVLPLDEQGWFRTSDSGGLDERGYLHVLGRSAELIVSGGENVYPSEIERVLESLPGVSAACVFGVEDPEWGEIVAAVIVGSIELGPLLDGFVRERLAVHKRPRLWAVTSTLPHTSLGKLDRRAAAREYADKLRLIESGSDAT